MSNRKIINVTFGLMVAGICLYVLFPRFRNDWGFESSMPSNMAQSGGLTDARSRKADVCSSEQLRCKFGIHVDADGTFRVSLYFVESDFFDGCIFKGQDLDVFIYSPEGNFLRAEEAPFG